MHKYVLMIIWRNNQLMEYFLTRFCECDIKEIVKERMQL